MGGHKWECLDVRLTQSYQDHAVCLAHARVRYQASGRPDQLSRVLKVIAMSDSPFKTTLFLDSDARPCYTLEEILATLFMRNESIFSVSDILVGSAYSAPDPFPKVERMEPVAALEESTKGRNDPPASIGEPSGGMVFYRSDRPVVRGMLKDWLNRYCDNVRTAKHHKDQPDFRKAMWHSQRVNGLRVMMMLPMWNMKGWRAVMPIGKTCCTPNVTNWYAPTIIDHDCEYSTKDVAWLTRTFARRTTSLETPATPNQARRAAQAKLACTSLLTMVSTMIPQAALALRGSYLY